MSALVFGQSPPITVGGLTLAERAVLLADRAGFRPVRVVGLGPASRQRLRLRGVETLDAPVAAPVSAAGPEGVVVVGPNVLLDQRTVIDCAARALRDRMGSAVARLDGRPLVLALSPGTVARVGACRTIDEMADTLARERLLDEPPLDGFCQRVGDEPAARRAERQYIQHLNGRESFFTKIIRRFSVPLTSRLVRLGVGPTHVTLAGLALAIASAWCISRGSYLAGVAGAVLYYASMVFDCSDGEVARLTVRDGKFGAWLETLADYSTYFLLLAALVVASADRPDADRYRVAAAIALVGSVVVVAVAAYLRHRVAAADPGQFDEASARAMASASPLHRFARWGRQWIKRSTIAHLVLVLALANQLPWLLYLWAFGASVSAVMFLAVEPFVVRRVAVAPLGPRDLDAK